MNKNLLNYLSCSPQWRPVVQSFAIVICVQLGGSSCANGPSLSTDYAETARENFELAQAEFADRDWEEVISYADFVRIRFPFSRYAVEAELLVARAQFELQNYLVAQDSFTQFAKLHPTHKHVRNGWISYMVVVSLYMALPDTVWPLPPHYQLDQSVLKQALSELDSFFDRHSGTIMAPRARELQATIQRKLLDHDLYVAEFYLDRELPHAAISRLEVARKRFPGVERTADVMFLLGRTYMRLDEVELARSTFSELQVQHPSHHKGVQARLYLDYIYRIHGPSDPNRVRPKHEKQHPKSPPSLKPGTFRRASAKK